VTTPTRHVVSSDGVALAVQESGDPTAPTVVAIHGYPDDHHVWDGVAALLAPDFHVVTYDVRGAGASEAPRQRSGYALSQLSDDLGAVIDAVSPDRPVHLLAHDWGSIQSWAAVTDPRFATRLASFTSISGPSLDMAGAWLRRLDSHPIASLKQLAASYYIGVFQAPYLPEALVRAGVLDRLVALSAGGGWRRPEPAPGAQARNRRDAVNGLELYRANFLGKVTRPAPGRAVVPVQVLAPRHDAHVTARLQKEAPVPYVDVLVTHEIDGNHWVVAQDPQLIVERLRDFVRYVEERTPADGR
jgi:pimeloyl-ACP methyl ester carboxylesterase